MYQHLHGVLFTYFHGSISQVTQKGRAAKTFYNLDGALAAWLRCLFAETNKVSQNTSLPMTIKSNQTYPSLTSCLGSSECRMEFKHMFKQNT